jgi:hypothetical protein
MHLWGFHFVCGFVCTSAKNNGGPSTVKIGWTTRNLSKRMARGQRSACNRRGQPEHGRSGTQTEMKAKRSKMNMEAK